MQRRHRNAECWTRLRQDSGFLRTRSQTFVKYLTWIRRHFIFGSGRTLSGLYKWHRLITNIYEFRLYRWLPEFEQESDSQIWKKFGPGSAFTNVGTGAESESENVTPATSGHLVLGRPLRRFPAGLADRTCLANLSSNILDTWLDHRN